MTPEVWIQAGAVLMFLAVALGAFAAHGLKSRLEPEMLTIFETGVRYHVYHALALLALGASRGPDRGGPSEGADATRGLSRRRGSASRRAARTRRFPR